MTDVDLDQLLNEAIRGLKNQQVPECAASLLPDTRRSPLAPVRANQYSASLAVALALSVLFAVPGYVVSVRNTTPQTQARHGEHASSGPPRGPLSEADVRLVPGEKVPGLIHRSPITVVTDGSTEARKQLQQELLAVQQRLQELTQHAMLHGVKERVASLRIQLQSMVAMSE